MFKNKEKQMLDNHTKAILELTDLIGQLIDCLKEHNIEFNYVKGRLLDEKTNDKTSC